MNNSHIKEDNAIKVPEAADSHQANEIFGEEFISKDLLNQLDSDSPVRSFRQSSQEVKIEEDESKPFECFELGMDLDLFCKGEYNRKRTVPDKKRRSLNICTREKSSTLLQYPKKFINYSQKVIGQLKLDGIDDYWTVQGKRSGWVCSDCRNFNYENRKKCNMCQKDRSLFIFGLKNKNINVFIEEKQVKAVKPQATKIFADKQVTDKPKKLIVRSKDWKCKECKNINFSFRTACNRCSASKPK